MPLERWFVRKHGATDGPFTAAQISRRMVDGKLDWTCEVWREGLGSYRPARRDERLVLAVAGARGLGGATVRLESVNKLLNSTSSSDTRIEAMPRGLLDSAPGAASEPSASSGRLPTWTANAAPDARPSEPLDSPSTLLEMRPGSLAGSGRSVPPPPPPPRARSARVSQPPRVYPAVPPPALSVSPSSFPPPVPPLPASRSSFPPPTPSLVPPSFLNSRAEAHASAPPVVPSLALASVRPSAPTGELSRTTLTGTGRHSGRPGRAVWLVLLAFSAGAVVAIGPGRLTDLARAVPEGLRLQVSRVTAAAAPTEASRPAAVVAQPSVEAAPGAPQSPPLLEGQALYDARDSNSRVVEPQGTGEQPDPQAAPVVPASERRTRDDGRASTAPEGEAPASSQVRAELKRASPLVASCLAHPARGLAFELAISGATGRVQKLHISEPTLRAGVRECVKEAFVDFHVAPFSKPVAHIKHRYSW